MIIGISGKARSGKDTVAARLCSAYGFTRVAFADPLRDEVLERMPRTLQALHDLTCDIHCATNVERDQCIVDMIRVRKPKGVRELLQEYGTEVRRRDNTSYWTDKWLARAMRLENVVASDVRFPNEALAVKMAGGVLWRVARPGIDTGTHESETALDTWTEWDAVLPNDGTILRLWELVDRKYAVARYASDPGPYIVDGGNE